MKSEWKTQPLGCFVSDGFQNGLYRPASDYGSGVPIVRINDFDNDGRFTGGTLERLQVSGDELTRFELQQFDILINRVNSLTHIGKSALVGELAERTVYESNMMRLRLSDCALDAGFVAQYLLLDRTREFFRKVAKQAVAQCSINQDDVKSLHCPTIPLPEQQKIAAILSTWDRAIELTEKLIAAKQKRKQALMQQLLTGKVRFKEFEGTSWKEVKLGKLFKERRETGYLELPLLSITSGEGIVHRDSLDRKDSSNADKSKYLRICPGDIGYNTMRMWQGVSALSGHEGIVSPAYTICTPSSDVDPLFMSYLFKYPPLVHVFWRYSQGMVDDTLNLKFSAFSTIKVQVPSRIEQERVGTVLAKMDAEITFLTRKVDQLRRQKKGLMQQLLTGKVRVKIDSETTKG